MRDVPHHHSSSSCVGNPAQIPNDARNSVDCETPACMLPRGAMADDQGRPSAWRGPPQVRAAAAASCARAAAWSSSCWRAATQARWPRGCADTSRAWPGLRRRPRGGTRGRSSWSASAGGGPARLPGERPALHDRLCHACPGFVSLLSACCHMDFILAGVVGYPAPMPCGVRPAGQTKFCCRQHMSACKQAAGATLVIY